MDKNRSFRKTQGTQIDLQDLLHRLCRQWKQILICSLVCAVLAGGYSYLAVMQDGAGRPDSAQGKDTDAADAEIAVDDAEQEEPAKVKTKEEQEQGVADAVCLLRETSRLEEYLKDSVLMQTDANHKNRTVLLYSIENADHRSMQKMMESYFSFLTNGGAVKAIRQTDRAWKSIDSSYLAELITVSQKAGGTYQIQTDVSDVRLPLEMLLYIEVAGSDSEMAAKLAGSIQDVLRDHSRVVQDICGSHTLSFVSSEAGEKADASLLTLQREKRSMLTANRTALKTMLDGFDKEQKIMYQKAASRIAQSQPEKPEDTETVNTGVSTAGQQMEAADSASGSRSGAGSAQSGQDGQPEDQSGESGTVLEKEGQPRRVSILYVLCGLPGGVFLYCVAFTAWYVLRDTIKSAREFKLYYTLPFYGCIPLKHTGTKGTADTAGETVAGRIRLACKKHGVSKLFLSAEFAADQEAENCLQELAEQLHGWGIDAVPAAGVAHNPSLWDMLFETEAVLMICRMDTTTYQAVDSALDFYLENDLEIFGAAALQTSYR